MQKFGKRKEIYRIRKFFYEKNLFRFIAFFNLCENI